MDYYERYWNRSFEKDGIATSPPVWEESNLKRIINIIKPYCQGNVLDIGCGDGFFTFQLSKLSKVKKVTGVDISKIAISSAKEKYPQIDFGVASATNLSFPKDSFDFVAMVELVEHIIDIEQMLKEANRVLKLRGYILITTTDFNLLKRIMIATFFWEKYFYPTNPHIRFFTKKTLGDLLNKNGFEIVKYKWNGSYLSLMPKGQIMITQKVKAV